MSEAPRLTFAGHVGSYLIRASTHGAQISDVPIAVAKRSARLLGQVQGFSVDG